MTHRRLGGGLILAALSLSGCSADIDADAVTVPASARTPVTVPSQSPVLSPRSTLSSAPATQAPTPTPTPVPTPVLVNRTITFGFSVHGRPLTATEIGNPASIHRVLIVGSIHGDELAGDQIAAALKIATPRTDADLWIVPMLNPDGAAAHTRQNANGVDLNRNFAYRWQPINHRGSLDYSGPAPLSEPESAAAATLIDRIRPTLAIWFHQHLAVVDDSEGPVAIERRFSALVGLPLARLTDYPGSVAGWQNFTFGPTAFVVELAAAPLSPAAAHRYGAAIDTIATMN